MGGGRDRQGSLINFFMKNILKLGLAYANDRISKSNHHWDILFLLRPSVFCVRRLTECLHRKDGGALRTMSGEKLLKTIPVLQSQIDALLEFDCSSQDLNNGVINSCFMLLFRDLIRLFACYNDGVINLLEKYFDMQKKSARDALDLYKKFLIRMDRVAEFLKVAEVNLSNELLCLTETIH